MYADWPSLALKNWKEEHDERGQLLFRGPRCVIVIRTIMRWATQSG